MGSCSQWPSLVPTCRCGVGCGMGFSVNLVYLPFINCVDVPMYAYNICVLLVLIVLLCCYGHHPSYL